MLEGRANAKVESKARAQAKMDMATPGALDEAVDCTHQFGRDRGLETVLLDAEAALDSAPRPPTSARPRLS